MISYLDLKKINAPYESIILENTKSLLDSGHYILGKELEKFEKSFSSYCGVNHTIGVGNGLDALQLIFKGYMELGKLKKGDQILVPSNTYIASILAILNSGLVPKLIDTNLNNYNLNLETINKEIEAETKGILMVHLYGQITDGTSVRHFADENDVLLIEDAAQSHGATENGIKAGAIGHAAGFSFYPSKNLGCLGDGGAVTTNNKDLADCIRAISNYGSLQKYHHEYKGVNSRLNEFQASILVEKLKNLDSDNHKRQQIANRYLDEIKNEKIALPDWNRSQNHVFHIFAVRVKNRDDFQKYLLDADIQTLLHYPIAPHKQNALKEFSHLDLPISEKIHQEIISLPCNQVLTNDEVSYIIKVINAY